MTGQGSISGNHSDRLRLSGRNLYHIAVNPRLPNEENIRDLKALSEGDVHIWLIALDDPAVNVGDIFREVLSEDEKTRASRLLTGVYRDRFVTARGYMRIILSRYLDMHPGEIRFQYNKNGKPAIRPDVNSKHVSFNLSHSRNIALCAVTLNAAIGIDIEYPRLVPRAEKILERFFSELEREYFRTQPDKTKELAFMNLWTVKEAYSKALGRGLSSELRNIDLSPVFSRESPTILSRATVTGVQELWTVYRFRPGSEYVAALVLKGNAAKIRSYTACPELWYYRKFFP